MHMAMVGNSGPSQRRAPQTSPNEDGRISFSDVAKFISPLNQLVYLKGDWKIAPELENAVDSMLFLLFVIFLVITSPRLRRDKRGFCKFMTFNRGYY